MKNDSSEGSGGREKEEKAAIQHLNGVSIDRSGDRRYNCEVEQSSTGRN